ncbi:wash complex subunit 5 [Anaeramoeba flamelloides]|uniref:Wash complex subunit 5 n=1 Tax=Anaeramoeba flamelloides TaxID=1746091 RepID=A0ABQ8Y572_9EUKA|nr:wash complex subunit 5 [Anaeramoeba flamelloides]
MDLEDSNLAIITGLRIVSKGSLILTELQNLSENIPTPFLFNQTNTDKQTFLIYKTLFIDFQFLQNRSYYESQIENNEQLKDIDEEICDSYFEVIERFYNLFESIYKYGIQINSFVKDLNEGIFITQNLESLCADPDGQQILSEMLGLFGVMLLLMDKKIQGIIRERLIVAYIRYKGPTNLSDFDKVCDLCRKTGYIEENNKKPNKYPETYFSRMKLPETLIELVLSRLHSEDIYQQSKTYLLQEHRTTALSGQASLLYVILYFAPDKLNSDSSFMTEIVTKHFSDNFVIPFYLGYNVDLTYEWDKYKSASQALNKVLKRKQLKLIWSVHEKALPKLRKELRNNLVDGVLTNEFVLDNITDLMRLVRSANVTIRWIILHQTSQNKKIQNLISGYAKKKILNFILDLAQFEFLLTGILEELLDNKEKKWSKHKTEAEDCLIELSTFFSGEKELNRIRKEEQLQSWFKETAEKVKSLEDNDFKSTGLRIQELVRALEGVKSFHQIQSSLQIKQFIGHVETQLQQMLRTLNVKEEFLNNLSIVSDMTYAWKIMNDYIPLIQQKIKKHPSSVIKLRSTFLKMNSIVEQPLLRINQAGSKDQVTVSRYYTSALLGFVRRVLEIVPQTMFRTLQEIISLQTDKIKEIPTKIAKTSLKQWAQLDNRFLLAKHTNSIALFTQGILAMKKTLVGVVEINPKSLLEDGIRKQLVREIAKILNEKLFFKTSKIAEFEEKLEDLADTLDGFKRSFEYISDYMNIYGLKIWQEEFSRIVNYNVEQECNSFLKKKVRDHQSDYQSKTIPIPKFRKLDNQSITCMGRLARILLKITDVKSTSFITLMSAWFDPIKGNEIIGTKTIGLLSKSIGVAGLNGLDKLISFMLVDKLQNFVSRYWLILKNNPEFNRNLQFLSKKLRPISMTPLNHQKLYQQTISKSSQMLDLFHKIIMDLGQGQLLRKLISNQLNFLSKIGSGLLYSTLKILNKGLLSDVQSHYENPQDKTYVSEELISELNKYLELSGFSNPYMTIFITTKPIKMLPLILFMFTISHLQKLVYNKRLCSLVRIKKNEGIDGTPFVVGILSLLKQFHSSHLKNYLGYLGQYLRAEINKLQKDSKSLIYPEHITKLIMFLKEFSKIGNINKRTIEVYLPPYLLNCLED